MYSQSQPSVDTQCHNVLTVTAVCRHPVPQCTHSHSRLQTPCATMYSQSQPSADTQCHRLSLIHRSYLWGRTSPGISPWSTMWSTSLASKAPGVKLSLSARPNSQYVIISPLPCNNSHSDDDDDDVDEGLRCEVVSVSTAQPP